MQIVIIGGTGLIGKKLTTLLQQAGHTVKAASPSTGVNAITGEGLAQALDGANVVIDVSNSPSFDDGPVMEFFTTSTRNLLAAEAAAGVGHHIALSIVGSDRMLASGYFRAKVAQEDLIKASPIPYTIVRATQFFEFLEAIAYGSTEGQTVRVPRANLQPVAADDVVEALAIAATETPLTGTRDVAGPQALPLADLVSRVLSGKNDPRSVVADNSATYFGSPIDDRSLTPAGQAWLGQTTLDSWLQGNRSAA